MSTTYTCDWCGQEIGSRYGYADMSLIGNFEDGWAISSRVGRRHFHAGELDDEDSCLRQALALIDDGRSGERPQSKRQQREEAKNQWKRMPRERREALAFQALGDNRLVIREITDRINAELGYPQQPGGAVYGNEVASLVKRMCRQGQLEREPETFNVNHLRYRYFRRRGLEGPIADLERALSDVPASDGEEE